MFGVLDKHLGKLLGKIFYTGCRRLYPGLGWVGQVGGCLVGLNCLEADVSRRDIREREPQRRRWAKEAVEGSP